MEQKSTSARLVKDDGLRRLVHLPDGNQGVILTHDGTGMVITKDQQMGQISRDTASGRLRLQINGREMDVVEEKGKKR